MLLGIDVGGTFTDGVIFAQGEVIARVKQPTDERNIKQSLWSALDELLLKVDKDDIERVVLSTTLITNLLATGQGEPTALIMIPGYGMPYGEYNICEDTFFVRGFMDFRGREIENIDQDEVRDVLREITKRQIHRAAVVGKFSNRNHIQETMIKNIAKSDFPELDIYISSEVACRLNFPRRAVTTFYTAMILKEWNRFADEIETVFKQRHWNGRVEILKADGGTMTLDASRLQPCETAFSGPAAGNMGALALAGEAVNSVVLDIGGTTADISLLIEGKPLYASKGAKIDGRFTHINSLAVKSVPLGGDSVLSPDGDPLIRAYRLGPAACFGGDRPTVIDAFNVAFDLGIGNAAASYEKISRLGEQSGKPVQEVSRNVTDQVVLKLRAEITAMFREWEQEPAYKVWEVVNRKKFTLQRIIGIGAAAEAIIPLLAKDMGIDYLYHKYSPVANGLGAALVRPTIAVEVHIDTQSQKYSVNPQGHFGVIEKNSRFGLEKAKALALECLKNAAADRGLAHMTPQAQYYMEEQFNIVRGWDTAGKIFDIGIVIAPGFVEQFQGVIK
ncbi:MAG: hydantoinase/oxoprolinase family protein [Syntrophomonadaceae bacterium]|jgi:N-methylhydantoinase A/oxoprolinase/acetone carboxylase beta subunit|nr:hydantoinase/oxoprolinase family protein [Syntrophomonadaceae bacterium]